MRAVTATEASRSFAALMDSVEAGETVVVTRGGKRIATIAPAGTANGHILLDLLRQPKDAAFGADVAAARNAVEAQGTAWPDD